MTPAQLAGASLAVVALVLAVRGIALLQQRRAAATAELRALLGPVPTSDEIEAYAQQLHLHRHRAGTADSCGACRAEVRRAAPGGGAR